MTGLFAPPTYLPPAPKIKIEPQVQQQLALFATPVSPASVAPLGAAEQQHARKQHQQQRPVLCLRWFPRGSLGLQRRLVEGLCSDLGLDLVDLSRASLARPSVELQVSTCRSVL